MSKYLLDTCAWLDYETDREVLRAGVFEAVSAQPFVSLATMSIVEVSRKVAVGKLSLSHPIEKWLELAIPTGLIRTLDITIPIAVEAYSLPGRFHDDPADRIIVATARIHGLIILTSDRRILEYPSVRSEKSR